MDRLICGDVGFGKTEVAMRAVFKAVDNGRQAAVLVPTTVLAEQHYRTFSQRMAEFPVTVEMLSRFRSPAEQKEILERVALGQIDILIGTHRLVSKDVHFRDLGLLVIDEEQKFGVKVKERLKQLRAEVDVLTLTATPFLEPCTCRCWEFATSAASQRHPVIASRSKLASVASMKRSSAAPSSGNSIVVVRCTSCITVSMTSKNCRSDFSESFPKPRS
ncbi:MAG UNVERIFIED_CONTAM: DEAD/DEAH box helicase [Planctomycetaceae bacterium]